jgi:chromosome segregation ATPase
VAENSKLRDELQRAPDSAAQWAAERNQILTELERTTQLVAETEEAAAIALDRQIATAVKRAREEWAAEEEKLREEIRQLELERGNSSESSDQIADAVDSSRKEWAVERDRMRQELDAAMHLCARRGAESAELSAERDRLRQSLAEAEDDRLALAQRERAGIEDAHNEAAAAIERTRTELEAEKALLRRHAEEDLAELLTELDDSKVLLTEAQSAYAGVVSQLKESERRIAELFGERDQLREQLEDVTNAAAQKELERQQLKEEYDRTSRILDEATRPGNSLETTEFVVAEEVRVEELIRDLSTIIDDPATELSAVIRKTVERAQLDFYLKGLRFSVTGESATPTH